MKQTAVIHLQWKEFDWNDDIYTLFNKPEDYGVYQVYGDHPVYGRDTLLYIGKARDQTYSQRLKQHWDFDISHVSKFRKLHLSYFCGIDDVTRDNWGDSIDLVETLLINSHFPAYNSQNIKAILKKEIFEKELLVLNWDERGKLLPEVSSLRYSDYYWDEKFKYEEAILKK